MAGEFAGKVAIVTGGARGLGQGMVELFVEEGGRVVIADLREEEGQALAADLGDAVRFCRTDVSSRDEMQALVDYAVSEFGNLDAMVNNAGLTDNLHGDLLDADFERFNQIMNVNVLGVMLGTQIAARHMAKKRSGAIVNISSISGIHAGFGFFMYRASKSAVVNFTKSAAAELGKHLVRVNCVCPGNIPTDMGAFSHTGGMEDDKAKRIRQAINDTRMNWQPLKRQGAPRDIAEAVLFLSGDRSPQVTGQVMAVDGGATAGDPRSQIEDIMAARARVEAEG
ncbi:MAG: SDR family oxidoreductase [Novosphingobium sp.]|nr:SDR family oxidoreductase [Novosphingobium sp.]